jgi:hypothetical protein
VVEVVEDVEDVVGPLVVVVVVWLLVGVSRWTAGEVGDDPHAARMVNPATATETATHRRAIGRRAVTGRDTLSA